MSTPSDYLAGLHPVDGSGVLSRQGETIMLVSGPDAAPPLLAELLAAHTDVAGLGGDAAALADRVAGILAHVDVGVVVFGAAGDSALIAVFGHAWADVTTRNGEQRLALRQSREGVRSAFPGPVLAVRAGLGEVDTDPVPQYWGRLEQGVVHAGGLLLVAAEAVGATAFHDTAAAAAAGTAALAPVSPGQVPATTPLAPVPGAAPSEPAQPVEVAEEVEVPAEPLVNLVKAPPAPALNPLAEPTTPRPAEITGPIPPAPPTPPAPEPAPEPAPAPVVDRSLPFQSVVLVGDALPTHPRTPLPVASAPQPTVAPDVAPPAHPAAAQAVQVMGVYCKNGHFDDPMARYCAICGISMAQLTLVPRPGPRPPLGVLVLDDGAIFSLDGDYVLGRDPGRNPDVTDGRARPLRVDDPNGNISRAHARIHLDGWLVQVIDLGSANGTGVRRPNETSWQPLQKFVPITISPGTEVGFGRRQLRYESHRNT